MCEPTDLILSLSLSLTNALSLCEYVVIMCGYMSQIINKYKDTNINV